MFLRKAVLLGTCALALSVSAASAKSVRFTLQPQGRHSQVLARHVNGDLQLRYVLVNGDSLVFGDLGSTQTFMYGHGVALRFTQHGATVRVSAASVATTPRRVWVSFVKP